MKIIPTYCNDNYSSEEKLLRRKSFHRYFKPRVDLVRTIFNFLKLKGRESILDVGCGNGDVLVSLRKIYRQQGEMFGVDIAPGILRQANRINRQEKLGIKFSVGDGRELKFPGGRFDAVIVKHVLHNVDGPDRMLQECHRVLKPGGKLALVVTSKKSRLVQKRLKPKIAKLLNLDFFPEAESTVNLENIKSFLDKRFWDSKIIKLESKMALKKPEPYLDYIDSGRDFWGQISDQEWNRAMEFAAEYLGKQLNKKGALKDQSTLGVVLATKSELPYKERLLQ